jgi:hypothetical protein
MRPIRLMVIVYVWFCETYKRVMRNAQRHSNPLKLNKKRH